MTIARRPSAAAGTALALSMLGSTCPGANPTLADATVAGVPAVTSSFEHIGIRWPISGDDDLDGRVEVRFRLTGSQLWQEGLPLTRAHPGLIGEGGDRPDNRWAGSVFWLPPGSTVEIELSLVDPDGGSERRVITGITRLPMVPAADAPVRYVIPGEGGGDGSLGAPFLGLQSAADASRPGDVFEIAAGEYTPFQLLASGEAGRPIVFRGPSDGVAIVDGAGTDRGIVTIGNYDRITSQVMIERLELVDGRWAIDAQHSHDISVRHVVMRSVDYGYVNRRGDGNEGNQTICDCTLEGRTIWPAEGIPSERAIDVRGYGNVVCYNKISGFGDAVSLQPFTGESWGNDAYGNDISMIVDDPIEIDYNQANVRVWSNRVTSSRMGISLAPIYGGPAYVFRNTFVSLESSAYKMNREPAGLVIAHNSSLKRGNGTSSPRDWQNTLLRNNYLFGTRYVFEEYGLAPMSVDDWDYDALAREPECSGDVAPCFKWDNKRYADLGSLAAGAGIEAHGIEGSRTDLVAAPLPDTYQTPAPPFSYDLRLVAGAPEIDAGARLPNLNDPWVDDGRPDIGALEYGSAAPAYGPRSLGTGVTYIDYSSGSATPTPTGITPTTSPTGSATPDVTESTPTPDHAAYVPIAQSP